MGIWIFALGLVVVPALPMFIPLSVLLFSSFLCSALIWRGIRAARYPLYFFLGLLLNGWQLHSLFESQLPESFDGTWQTLEFKIVSIPQVSPLSTMFVADVRREQCASPSCPSLAAQRVRLAWYNPKQALTPGQVWQARAKLKRPRGLANPSGFDYQAWLLAQNIVATGYVEGGADLLAIEWCWASVRLAMSERIVRLAEGNDFARYWTALLIADTAAITPSDWQTLQATGTIHLVAISGSHIALVSLWAFALGGLWARCFAVIAPRFAGTVSHWFPPLLACLFALFYAGLADFSIPTLRAFLACVVVNLCWLVGLRIKPFNLLGLGVALISLSEPMAGQSNGFWLSFIAVLLLIHVFTGKPKQHPLLTLGWLQWVLALGLSVPLLWLGLGVSWLGPLGNIVAEPVITFVIVPGLFVAVCLSAVSWSLAQTLLSGLDRLFALLWKYLVWLEQLPQHAIWWSPKVLSPLELGLIFVGILLLLCPRGLRVRGLGLLMIAASALIQSPPQPDLRLTVLDVGQGLSVVVNTPEKTWIYDTGPTFSESMDAGSRIVAPFLHRQGVNDISLMVSHADLDHSGGAASLISQFTTDSLVVGEPLDIPGFVSNPPLQQRCEQGQTRQVGKASLRVLWPPQGSTGRGNRASCVVLLELPLPHEATDRTVRILFTGDIDREVERHLLPSLPTNIDLLIAPHHGSKSSSSQDFVKTLNPRFVVFSAGFKNRFNHPHPDIEARYRDQGVTTFNTATSGALIFTWQGNSESVRETRKAEAKLWYP